MGRPEHGLKASIGRRPPGNRSERALHLPETLRPRPPDHRVDNSASPPDHQRLPPRVAAIVGTDASRRVRSLSFFPLWNDRLDTPRCPLLHLSEVTYVKRHAARSSSRAASPPLNGPTLCAA